MEYLLLEGDSQQLLKELDENSVDSIITDPPYGLKFMGKKWDHQVPTVELWKEVLRVLKPGAFMLVACGTRTQHRMVVNIEDAGFEIRDVITWHYGSGFPKSMDISKAIDKQAGAEREVIGKYQSPEGTCADTERKNPNPMSWGVADRKGLADITAPATEEAKQWEGWGTALKPATEFWTLARKPLEENTVAENVLKHGTGGINIYDCRIDANGEKTGSNGAVGLTPDKGWNQNNMSRNVCRDQSTTQGRFPANLILDEFAAGELDKQSGVLKSGKASKEGHKRKESLNYESNINYADRSLNAGSLYGDTGGASRFFYVAKASQKERNAGLEEFEDTITSDGREKSIDNAFLRGETLRKNFHPTVKPISLMRYFIRLITPPGGTVCDPFNGSGTTGCGCALEPDLNLIYIGMDNEADYIKISTARIEYWKNEAENIINKK